MDVKTFIWEPRDTNMYVIEENNHILIIDPNDNKLVYKMCSEASSITVLLTHEHFDHICGLNKLRNVRDKNMRPCLVVSNEKCSERLKNSKTNMSAYAEVLAQLSEKQLPVDWTPFTCEEADVTFNNQYSFLWMEHTVSLFYTPGHSEGSCCIVLDDDIVFVGDSILESRLMVKFPCSSRKRYRDATVPLLEKLLKNATKIYPGHGDVLTRETALEIIKST